jgi:hypothetical protein
MASSGRHVLLGPVVFAGGDGEPAPVTRQATLRIRDGPNYPSQQVRPITGACPCRHPSQRFGIDLMEAAATNLTPHMGRDPNVALGRFYCLGSEGSRHRSAGRRRFLSTLHRPVSGTVSGSPGRCSLPPWSSRSRIPI